MTSYLKYLFVTVLFLGSLQVFAATGVIDPLFYTAQVCESAVCGITDSSPVNFGVFSFSPSSNVTISDTELRGFIWGKSFGYAVLNCADVVAPGGGPGGGCTSTNGNFKVANTTSGQLSGYAWGETAGWIKFGPFTESATPPVVINSQGEFNGYAWAQNFGWIKFDCSLTDYCVKTDWRPTTTPSVCTDPTANNYGGSLPCTYDGGGGGGGGGLCTDPGATNYLSGTPCTYPTICTDINANNTGELLPCTYTPRICEDSGALNYSGPAPCLYICSDNEDNDSDNLKDDQDPGCYTNGIYNPRDSDEYNGCSGPSCNPQPTYQCSDGVDNTDIEDKLEDESDPGCYTNGIYHSTDNDETDQPIICTDPSCNPQPSYECSDGVDNADIEDSDADRDDPGCYTGGVYYATDNSEDNCGDPVASNYGDSARCRYPSTVIDPTGSTCVGIACIVGGPLFNTTTQFVAPIGLFFGLALALANSLFANPITFSEIFIIPTRLWALLFIKRRYKPWGVVYDSVTKQPLDPAYVVLQDLQGNEITTCITDLDGRYGFLVPAGDYRMIANKTNYEFPSKKLAGKTNDELYSDLYFNEIITIKEGEVIIKNIPMDPLKFDWNEFAKQDQKLMKFYSKRDLWIARISRILFYFGFILTTAAVIVSPILYNIVIFLIYIILFIFQHTILRPRPFGSITYAGTPLAFAIIRVFAVENNREVVKKVSTQIGRYYCLVPNGTYYLTIERKNADQTYTLVHTSGVIHVTEGYINKKFRI